MHPRSGSEVVPLLSAVKTVFLPFSFQDHSRISISSIWCPCRNSSLRCMQPAHRFCHSQLLTGYHTQNVPQHFTGRMATGCSLLVLYYFILLSAGGRRLYQCRIFHHLLQWIEAPSHPGEQGDARWGCLVLAKLSLVSGAVLPPADGDSQPSTLRAVSTGESFQG